MARPVIALLTDFGLRDHYVAAMKGVMLGICPDATLVDISHDIPPQDILAAALELDAVVRYFPHRTVFVAVVDPGVGSSRRAVAVDGNGRRFVGPDNGLFSLVLEDTPGVTSVELREAKYALDPVSRTFEGRDRFAPAAAWLASGVAVSELGPAVDGLVQLRVPRPIASADGVDGVVLRVDHFGNLVTNIDTRTLSLVESGTIHVGGSAISGVSDTYAATAPGTLCAMVGSTGRLEIAVNGGNAAAALGARRGTVVQVRRRSGA
jgi:S-adenosylmethionine hydrolase